MFRKMIAVVGFACVMSLSPLPIAAQQTTTAGQDADKAGQEAKKAGENAGKATKDAAKATGKATKKAAKKTAKTTKNTAKKVEGAVTPDVSATCNDGTVQVAQTKAAACVNHGGVRP